MYKKVLSKQQESNASVYEAVGKMFLGNAATGRNLNPAALSLITKTVNKEQDPEYEELLEKPLWQFTGKDHEYMLKHVLMESLSVDGSSQPSNKKYVQGINGIASLFGCSKSTAQRIKNSGIIDDAITQVQRKILVDADLALQLIKESGYKVSE